MGEADDRKHHDTINYYNSDDQPNMLVAAILAGIVAAVVVLCVAGYVIWRDSLAPWMGNVECIVVAAIIVGFVWKIRKG